MCSTAWSARSSRVSSACASSTSTLFFLHGWLVGSEHDGGERRTPLRLFEDAVRPAFERLVDQGRIGAWGITAVGVPGAVLQALGRARRGVEATAERVGSASSSSSPRQPQR